VTDGTLTWMTGVKTLATHVVPTINAAATAAGRPTPRVVCSLPISVTSDVADTRDTVNERLAIYGTLPSYRAMLDREGADGPADVGLFGTREQVLEKLHELAEAGVTEFSASMAGGADDRDEPTTPSSNFRRPSASSLARQLGVLELVQVDTMVIMASSVVMRPTDAAGSSLGSLM